jgi:hypothetical protein
MSTRVIDTDKAFRLSQVHLQIVVVFWLVVPCSAFGLLRRLGGK